MEQRPPPDLRASYERVAGEYAARIFDELAHKPLDRALLDRFADAVRGQGPVCDLGCGPGHVARYLHGRGVEVQGVDLSPGMVAEARRLNPGIDFRQGDLRALDVADEAWAGIAAFYVIVHVPREELVPALRELGRVLRPGGLLLLAFHVGEETLHREEWWGKEVALDFLFFRPDEVIASLRAAGFTVEDVVERPPYEGVEHPSRRAYVFARKPAGMDAKSPAR
jgi:SAM-dependent methyltransferase